MTPFYIYIRRYTDKVIRNSKQELKTYIHDMKNVQAEDIVNTCTALIYKSISDLYDKILNEYFNKYDINFRNFPSVETFMYHADGATLKQRVARWVDEYNRFRNKSLLFYRLGLITKHSHRYVDEEVNLRIVREHKLFQYVTTDAGSYGEACEECRDHHGTFAINENVMLPPYHPDCDCIYWFHNTPIASDEPEDEDWMPEQEGV